MFLSSSGRKRINYNSLGDEPDVQPTNLFGRDSNLVFIDTAKHLLFSQECARALKLA